MIRASELRGRAVVDLDSAVKLGEVDDVALDPEGRRVAGLLVGRGQSLLGGGGSPIETFVPASGIHAIGRDVVTVRGAGRAGEADASGFPRLGHVVGRKMVTHGGTVLGAIDDVLVDPADGRIVGYTIGGSALGALGNLFGGGGDRPQADYVRADADLRVGPALVVVPDDAVVRAEAAPPRPGSPEAAAPTVFGWPDPEPVHAGSSSWIQELSQAPPPGNRAPTPKPAVPTEPVATPAMPSPAPPAAPADDPLAATQPLDVPPPPPRRRT